jgi:hypothetical protein
MKIYFEMELEEKYDKDIQATFFNFHVYPFIANKTPIKYLDKTCYTLEPLGTKFGSKKCITDSERELSVGRILQMEERIKTYALQELVPHLLPVLEEYQK